MTVLSERETSLDVLNAEPISEDEAADILRRVEGGFPDTDPNADFTGLVVDDTRKQSQPEQYESGEPIRANASGTDKLLWLLLMTAANPPVTELIPPILGSVFAAVDKYRPIFTNSTPREVRIEVFVEWGNPGEGLKLSLTDAANDTGKVDELVNAANGKSTAVPILLPARGTLWGNVKDVLQPLTSGTIIRGRVFDAQRYFTGIDG